MVNQASTEQEFQQRVIADAASLEEVTALLRKAGLNDAADRLDYLQELKDEDPDEPEMSLDSLRQLALFLMEEKQLPHPGIGLCSDGRLEIAWHIPENGIIAMRFPSPGLIEFAAVCGPLESETGRIRVNGHLPKREALKAVQTFIDRIETQ